MKFLGLLFSTCFILVTNYSVAQEISDDSFIGIWEYKSPKGKVKQVYQFLPDKVFSVTTEHGETETKVDGFYDTDKKGEFSRLKLNTTPAGDKTISHLKYYFIKFLGTDTVKLQLVTDRQERWRSENKKNTVLFIRQKEKPKKK